MKREINVGDLFINTKIEQHGNCIRYIIFYDGKRIKYKAFHFFKDGVRTQEYERDDIKTFLINCKDANIQHIKVKKI